MKIYKIIAIAVLLFGLLMGGLLAGGVLFSQRLLNVNAQQIEDDDGNEANEANEDNEDETNVSRDQMGITPEEARAVAEAANPGAKTLGVEIDRVNENGGAAIYEVELDNGIDVAVDGSNGNILGTKQRNAEY